MYSAVEIEAEILLPMDPAWSIRRDDETTKGVVWSKVCSKRHVAVVPWIQSHIGQTTKTDNRFLTALVETAHKHTDGNSVARE
jgi:hypothetical protein